MDESGVKYNAAQGPFGMIFIRFEVKYNFPKPLKQFIMANTGRTVATLLIGAAIGAAVGYILATDKETRTENVDKLKDKFSSLKSRFGKKAQDLEEERKQFSAYKAKAHLLFEQQKPVAQLQEIGNF